MHNFEKLFAALTICVFGIAPASAQSVFSSPTTNGTWSVSGLHTLIAFHTTGNYPNGIFVLAFDATSAPASGAVSPSGCFYDQPTVTPALASTLGMSNTSNPVSVQTGLTLVLSSTGCATYTPVSGYLSVTYQ